MWFWQDYGLFVVFAALGLVAWLNARWYRGNEAQRLLDRFRLPYRQKEKRPEDMTLEDALSRIVRLSDMKPLSEIMASHPEGRRSVWKRLATKLRR
jgi:hypothetical protein